MPKIAILRHGGPGGKVELVSAIGLIGLVVRLDPKIDLWKLKASRLDLEIESKFS